MANRTVTGTILQPDGTAYPDWGVKFTLVKDIISDGVVYPKEYKEVSTSADGTFTTTLAIPDSGTAYYKAELRSGEIYDFNLDAGASIDLSTIISVAVIAGAISPAQSLMTTHESSYLHSEYNVKAYGAVGDGVTDDSAAVIAAIQAAYTAGGGVVFFPRGTYYILSQIAIPNNDATQPVQPPITLMGEGGRWDGQMGSDTAGASILDLRYSTENAKITSFGRGILDINGLNLTDGGTSTIPFILITNTTVKISNNSFWGNPTKSLSTCNQDAIVLGGTTAQTGKLASDAFQGYGTIIDGNYFSRIRRGIYGRTWCNSVVITNNTWSLLCGSDANAGAIEIDGSVGFARGNYFSGNLIEMPGYVYGYVFKDSANNHVFGDSFWDGGVGTLASIRLIGTSGDNSFFGCYFTGAASILDSTGGNDYIATEGRRVVSPMEFTKPIIYRPIGDDTVGTDVFLSVNRSVSDSVNPNATILRLTKSGSLSVRGTESSPNGVINAVNEGGFNTAYGVGQIVSTTDLDLYAASTGNAVGISRGYFGLPIYTTAARPSTNGRPGVIIYDSNLAKCIIYNGSDWVNVDGTALS